MPRPGPEDGETELDRLVIDLDELARQGPGPYRVRATLHTAWVDDVLRDTDASPAGAGSARLEVVVQGDGRVLLRGPIAVAYQVPCARCLAPARVDAGADLCVTAVPAARLRAEIEAAERAATDPDGIELSSEDLTQVAYEGRRIDLGRVLAEQLLLAYPIRALCERGDGCRGLCPSCGADLNLTADGRCERCARTGVDSAAPPDEAAWKAALRRLQKS